MPTTAILHTVEHLRYLQENDCSRSGVLPGLLALAVLFPLVCVSLGGAT
jgi:hypothetical protein